MKTFIKAISLAVALLAPFSFAQESDVPAATSSSAMSSAAEISSAVESSSSVVASSAVESSSSAMVSSSSIVESSSSDAFASFMDQQLSPDSDPFASSSSTESSSSAEEESSSSGEGLVLIGGDESSSSRRMVYGKDAPVYTFVATAGLKSPSRGMFSFEYVVSQEIFNVGIHFSDYTDEVVQFGVSAIYYPMEVRYFYTFLTSDWVHGTYERDRDIGAGVYKEFEETENYWRVVIGIGTEALFLTHFGLYAEVGFEFFAGDGGYYTHLNKEYGRLDNDNFEIPYGIGIMIPF
jgi:hypothetical protein